MFTSFVFLLLLVVYGARSCDIPSEPTPNPSHCSYLDVAIDLIEKAKENMPPCCSCPGIIPPVHKAADCYELLQMGHKKSDIYKIWLSNRSKHLNVYCDMDTDGGGWTVIQRRGNFQNRKDYFNQNWTTYKEGFGDIQKEFWLGNDNIFALTNQKLYSVRFDLMDVGLDRKFAVYDSFRVGNEQDNYPLSISEYSGDAGDSMIPLSKQKFSTKDRDNRDSVTDCGRHYEGGWWYGPCHRGSLNGLNYKGKHESYADGINWQSWKGVHESLEWTEIKIRPLSSINDVKNEEAN